MATITEPIPKGGGGTFTGVPPGAKGSTLGSGVRSVAIIESFLKDRTPAADEVPEQDAEIRWGGPSQFQWSITKPIGLTPRGVVVGGHDDDDDDEEIPGPKTLEFIETERVEETVRVTNPQDVEQWVDVARIQEITFSVPADITDALDQLRSGDITELFFKYILNFEEPA